MADIYHTLGVSRGASDLEIKTAYRKLAMTNHPDRNNGAKEAEEKFKAITEAYDVLRDPDKRALYDRYGEAGLRGGAGGFHHVDLSEALSIFMRDLGGLGGFGELFGAAGRASTGPRTGSDIKIAMPMTLVEVASGAEKTVTVKLLEPCDRCEGHGAEPGSASTKCTTCHGTGEVLYTEVLVTYPQLALGANVDVPMVTGSVNLQVPPGTQSGQVFNLRGRGLPRINSSSTGDLHVRLQLWTPDALSEEEQSLIGRLAEVQAVPAPRPKGLWSKIRESLGA